MGESGKTEGYDPRLSRCQTVTYPPICNTRGPPPWLLIHTLQQDSTCRDNLETSSITWMFYAFFEAVCLTFLYQSHILLRLAPTPWFKFLAPQPQLGMSLPQQQPSQPQGPWWPLLRLLLLPPLRPWPPLPWPQPPLLPQLPWLLNWFLSSLSLQLQPLHPLLPLHLSRWSSRAGSRC